MTNTEGLIVVYIVAEIFAGLIGCSVIAVIYTLFKKFPKILIWLIVIFAGMAVNMAYSIRVDAGMMLATATVLAIPMTVLVPSVFFSRTHQGDIQLGRVLLCYIVLLIAGSVTPLLLVGSGLFMTPGIYWYTPESNGFIFFIMMLVYTGLATAVYWIFDRIQHCADRDSHVKA